MPPAIATFLELDDCFARARGPVTEFTVVMPLSDSCLSSSSSFRRYRHLAMEARVLGDEDFAHAALSERIEDSVVIELGRDRHEPSRRESVVRRPSVGRGRRKRKRSQTEQRSQRRRNGEDRKVRVSPDGATALRAVAPFVCQ
jgi:hypothetical protein